MSFDSANMSDMNQPPAVDIDICVASDKPQSASPSNSVEDQRRSGLDFLLAACICGAAIIFWFWNVHPREAAPRTSVPPAALTGQLAAAAALNIEGTRLYQAGNFAAAEALFRKAISDAPNNALGYCNLGAALNAQKRYEEAIPILQKSLALDPSFTLARNNLNWAIDQQARLKKGR